VSEVTLETFRDAAQRVVRNLDSGEPEPVSEIRSEIQKAMVSDGPDDSADEAAMIRKISQKVSTKVAQMIWPERSLEVRRKEAEFTVENEALMRLVEKEVQSALRRLNG